MGRYVGRRFLSGLLTLFLFVTLLFFAISAVLPGDWTSQFILTGEARAALQEQLGIDRPIWVQYWDWVRAAFTLDLGTSFTGASVGDMISSTLPSTLLVLFVGLVVAFALGSWIGRATAFGAESVVSSIVTFVAIVFLAAFPPAVAFAIERLGRNTLGFASYGQVSELEPDLWELSEMSPSQVAWRMVLAIFVTLFVVWALSRIVSRLTRRPVSGWLQAAAAIAATLGAWYAMGLGGRAFDISLALAVLIFGVLILTFGEVILITRAAMEDSLLEDYVMVARAKGLPEKRVRDHHAARTALLPVLSRFVVSVPYFFTGLVILESVFAGTGSGVIGYRAGLGIGTLIFDSIRLQDLPVVIGSLFIVGLLTLVLRIGLDVAHAALDPRIRFGAAQDA